MSIEKLISAVKALQQRETKYPREDLYFEIVNLLPKLSLESPILEMFVSNLAKQCLEMGTAVDYDKVIDRLNTIKNLKPFNLKFLANSSIPVPAEDRNKVILFIQNHYDGVGDFMHGVSFARDLKEILGDQYEICGVVVTTTTEKNSEVKKRADFVKEVLNSGKHSFDHWFLEEELRSTGEMVKFKSTPELDFSATLGQAAMSLQIATGFGQITAFEKHLPKGVEVVQCMEYGHKRPNSEWYNYRWILKDASMGLGEPGAVATYGIKLYAPQISESTCADRLLQMSQEAHNASFIQHLLGAKSPDTSSVSDYFDTHIFMPAYLQTTTGATAFILTQVLRNYPLQKTCDFLIPKGVVDEKQIREILGGFGFKGSEILFETPQTEVTDSSKAKIRILSFFIKEDADYKALYELAEHATGCSGDNSTSLSFSSLGLPYFQYKASVFGDFFTVQLRHTLDAEMAQCEGTLHEGFKNLAEYFMTLCKVAEYEDIYTWCATVARLSNAPHLIEAWHYFREVLFKKYNYRDHFPAIVKTVLTLSQPEADIGSIFQQSDRLQALKEMGLLHPVQGREDFVWLTMLASPSLYQGVQNGYIQPKIMLKEFQAQLPIGHYTRWSEMVEKYHTWMRRILEKTPLLEGQHGQSLFLAMRLGLDSINSEWFEMGFDNPKVLEAYLNRNSDEIIQKLAGFIENEDVLAVEIAVKHFFKRDPEHLEKILKIIDSASETSFGGLFSSVRQAEKFKQIVDKLLTIKDEGFKEKIFDILRGSREQSYGEYIWDKLKTAPPAPMLPGFRTKKSEEINPPITKDKENKMKKKS